MDTTANEFIEHFQKPGKCFICQGEVSNFKSNNHRKVVICVRRFRTLASRYLNLQNRQGNRNKDNCDIIEEVDVLETMKLIEIFKDKQNENTDQYDSQLSVTCDACFPFLESFCQIYEQWAYLQLQLNWRLKQISVLMRRKRRKKQSEAESNCKLNPTQRKFTNSFLSRLKDKSSPKDFPHLKLDRLKPEEIYLFFNKRKLNFSLGSSELKRILLEEDKKCTSEFLSSDNNDIDYDEEIEDFSEANENQVEAQTTKTRNVPQSFSDTGNPTNRNYKSPHKCQFCQKKFSSVKKLDLHLKVHLSSTHPFQCCYCAMTFTKATQRVQHEKKHLEDRPFRCGLCHRDFLEMHNCRLHQKNVHGIKNGKGPVIRRQPADATCSICKKTFASLFNLKQHLVLHSNERRFKCNFCDKRFRRNEHRQNHERSNHLGRPKPFICKLCDRSFRQTTYLYTHVLASHKMDKSQYKKLDPSLNTRKKKFLKHHDNNGDVKLKNNRRRSLLDSGPEPTTFSFNINQVNDNEAEVKEKKFEIHQHSGVQEDEDYFEASEEFIAKREPENRNFLNE